MYSKYAGPKHNLAEFVELKTLLRQMIILSEKRMKNKSKCLNLSLKMFQNVISTCSYEYHWNAWFLQAEKVTKKVPNLLQYFDFPPPVTLEDA